MFTLDVEGDIEAITLQLSLRAVCIRAVGPRAVVSNYEVAGLIDRAV